VLARGDPARIVRQAPFEALLLIGPDVRDLMTRFEPAEGVIAASPEDHGLRLLVRPGACGRIKAEALAAGARLEDTHKRLEDAALVLVHDPEAKSWTLD
jgi:hypothetical protein